MLDRKLGFRPDRRLGYRFARRPLRSLLGRGFGRGLLRLAEMEHRQLPAPAGAAAFLRVT